MAQFPALPLWTDSYLADTMHLDCAESGAYLHLLIAAWRSPDCNLPDDDKRLARFAKCSTRQWAKIKPVVMEFWDIEEHKWTQKRLLKERFYVISKREQQSQAGQASALKRKEIALTDVELPLQREDNEEATPIPIPIPIPNKDNINGFHFEDFYKLYPLKKSRKPAKAIYTKIIKSGVKHEDLIKGLNNYLADIKSNKTEKRFIKHPTTWLNQECWNDEYNSKPKRKRL